MQKKVIKKESIKKPTISKMETVGTSAINAQVKKTIIFQAKNGAIELRGDITKETLWATQAQIIELFDIDQSVVSRHINNILKDGELDKESNMQKMHIANSDKPINLYSLDIILSVGYKTNSSRAIEFRKWSNKILKEYLTKGYALNKKVIAKNYEEFLNYVNDIKALLPESNFSDIKNVLELVNAFADTWLSLDSYDRENYTKTKITKKKVSLTSAELSLALLELKNDLIKKGEATDIFAVDRNKNSLEGIIGNVMQSLGGNDVYISIEEKAVHLLYFIIKNHPFIDGNKRSGAFAFIWFLNKYKLLDKNKISPEALSAIALLIAQSDANHKDKMIKLVMSLISKK